MQRQVRRAERRLSRQKAAENRARRAFCGAFAPRRRPNRPVLPRVAPRKPGRGAFPAPPPAPATRPMCARRRQTRRFPAKSRPRQAASRRVFRPRPRFFRQVRPAHTPPTAFSRRLAPGNPREGVFSFPAHALVAAPAHKAVAPRGDPILSPPKQETAAHSRVKFREIRGRGYQPSICKKPPAEGATSDRITDCEEETREYRNESSANQY